MGVSPEAGRAYSDRRPGEIWRSLEDVIATCNREETDLLLIAGDLFHRQPLKKELREVNAMLGELKKTRVVLVAGNHDYVSKRSCYQDFAWEECVHFLGKSGELEWVEFPDLQVAVYGKSYHSREIRQPLDDTWKRRHIQPQEILLLHGGDETHIPFRREDVSSLGYDYVALGHIHKPQVVIQGKAAYCGSLEPTDRGDVGEHGYIRGSLTEERVTVQFVPHGKREYIPLAIRVGEDSTAYGIRKKLEEEIKKRGRHNLYKIRLQGKKSSELLLDFEEMDVFGNIVEWTDDTGPAYDLERLKEKNRGNLLGQLIEKMEKMPEDSLDYRALSRGVEALLETGK